MLFTNKCKVDTGMYQSNAYIHVMKFLQQKREETKKKDLRKATRDQYEKINKCFHCFFLVSGQLCRIHRDSIFLNHVQEENDPTHTLDLMSPESSLLSENVNELLATNAPGSFHVKSTKKKNNSAPYHLRFC